MFLKKYNFFFALTCFLLFFRQFKTFKILDVRTDNIVDVCNWNQAVQQEAMDSRCAYLIFGRIDSHLFEGPEMQSKKNL